MRTRVTTQLRNNGLKAIDADSTVTGGDFLDKICCWQSIICGEHSLYRANVATESKRKNSLKRWWMVLPKPWRKHW